MLQRRIAAILALLSFIVLACGGVSTFAPAQSDSGTYQQIALWFNRLDVPRKLKFQVLLTAAGYWPAVRNLDFNHRLFSAIQRFQSENGFPQNGVLDAGQLAALKRLGLAFLSKCGFSKVAHPTQNISVWIPTGLNLLSTNTPTGLSYTTLDRKVQITFDYFPTINLTYSLDALKTSIKEKNGTIHYAKETDDFFAIWASFESTDEYARYHKVGVGGIGFNLYWDRSDPDLHGDRIATLMSASIWETMSHAPSVEPFTDDPNELYDLGNSVSSQPDPSRTDSIGHAANVSPDGGNRSADLTQHDQPLAPADLERNATYRESLFKTLKESDIKYSFEFMTVTVPAGLVAGITVPVPVSHIRYSDTVFFEFDRADLRQDAQGVIADFARTIAQDKSLRSLLIVGHTDAIGSDEYNTDLSKRRAVTVATNLQTLGIAKELIGIVPMGKSQPIAANDTEDGRTRNRRVEFFISDVPGATRAAIEQIKFNPCFISDGNDARAQNCTPTTDKVPVLPSSGEGPPLAAIDLSRSAIPAPIYISRPALPMDNLERSSLQDPQ